MNRMPIPERELKRTKHDVTAPVRTPTLIGCAFSIDREFFFEIGTYDEGMNIWGSENLEMALRVKLKSKVSRLIPFKKPTIFLCLRYGNVVARWK